MKIKICGLCSEEAVDAAVEAGADLVGFVFAPGSPREVTAARAGALGERAAHLPKVAVLRSAGHATVYAIREVFAADLLQADAHTLVGLLLPRGMQPLPVFRDGEPVQIADQSLLLYEAPESGAGMQADWDAAATLARRTRLMLAGGLHAGNVGEAIRRVRPWGVDVSSGVETAPGVKCPDKIRDFVEAARAAARETR